MEFLTSHKWYECKCNRLGCQFCDGGLAACTVCGGFEGSLPTDCPGVRMTQVQIDLVYEGKIDFRVGRGWVTPDGTGRSMGDIDILAQRMRYEAHT